MSTNVIKRTPAAGGPSYNPGDAFQVPDQGQYGQRDRDFHVGIDYKARAGTQIPAASSGEVVYAGPSKGFHHAVMVRSIDPNGRAYYSVYGHVDPAGALPIGTKVSIGQPIGAVGTPHPDEGELSTGPHFHFQITTEEKLKAANKVPGRGGLGFSTKDVDVFENPDEFKGWAAVDKAPYNAMTYVPIRDGVAYQPMPNLARTQQADQLFSAANSFSPPGLSPTDIDRFYSETGNPSTGPSGFLGNGVRRGATGPNDTPDISRAAIDRLYNFTQLGRSATTPTAANGVTPLNRTSPMPWYSSPAVTGNYIPTDNFSWNNVPTGISGSNFKNGGPSPAGGPGNAPSPVLRAPLDRRSAAPDGRAPTSAQGALAATPASQPYTAGTGGVLGKFFLDSLITPAEAAPPLAPGAPPLRPYFPGQAPASGDRSGDAPGEPSPDSYPQLRRVSPAFSGMTPPDPGQPMPPPQSDGTLGIFTGKPMPSWTVPPPLGGLRNNSSVSGNGDLVDFLTSLLPRNPTLPEPPQQPADSKPERRLARVSPATVFDTGAPAVPFASSGDANYPGGLLGMFAALDGSDPSKPAPSPDDEQERAKLQALEDRLTSTGSINDAWELYKVRIASRR